MSDKSTSRSPDEIRADIEETREDLGDTVEALAAKSDVKARAKGRVDELKADATAKKDDLTAKLKSAAPGGGDQPGTGTGTGTGGDPSSSSVQDQAKALGDQGVAAVKANPLPYAIGGALVLGFLVGRRRGARR